MSGNTPLIEVDGINAKLECFNPTGSIKGRIAEFIIKKSEELGILKPGMTIVEATSGNTGIALCYYAGKKGYNTRIVMPSNMSDERKKILRSLGADLELCSPGDFKEAKRIRDKIAEDDNYFNPDQFSNPLNVECHYKTTGQEIIKQMRNKGKTIDAFVAGVGTGGTLIGVAKALKEVNPYVEIIAVEPYESAVMSGGKPGSHEIQGIGDGSASNLANNENGLHQLITDVIRVKSKNAKESAKYLSQKHGFCVGVSSGCNYLASRIMLPSFSNIVTVFPDGFRKYESFGLRHCEAGRCPYENERNDVLEQFLSFS